MCDYQGYEFGAGTYPDSICIDGRLHDADDSPGPGLVNLQEEDIPCPICRPNDAIEWWYGCFEGTCAVGDERDWETINAENRANAVSLVNDIRANRGLSAASTPEVKL